MRDRPTKVTDKQPTTTASPRQSRIHVIALIGVIAIAGGAFWSRQQLSRPGADSYSKVADLYMHQHRFKDAANLYRQATKADPTDGTLDFRLSYALANAGDNSGATDAARKATELLPKDATAWRRLGTLEAHAGHGDVAYAAFRRAHELDPTTRSDLLNMATQGLFEPDLAYDKQELEHYLATQPNDYEAWYLLAATDERLPRTPAILTDGIAAGERAQTGLRKDIRLARVLGEFYLAANRPADALKAYQQGLASTPHSSEMQHGIAISQARLGHSGTP